MTRRPIICVSLLCLSSGVCAQDAVELFSLTFTPGPFADVLLGPPPIEEIHPAVDQTSDDGSRTRLLESLQKIEESINAEEALNGPRSSNLVGPLTSLAAVHRELGDELLAIAALARARDITRINEGLHSLERQVAVVEQMIDSLEAAGVVDESASLQDSLLELARMNEGDPRVASILAAVAARQMAAVNEYLEKGTWPGPRTPDQATEGSGWEPSTHPFERPSAARKLEQIRRRYDDGIRAALADDDYEIADALGAESVILQTYHVVDAVNDLVEEGVRPLQPDPVRSALQPTPPDELARAALRRARRLYSAAMQAALEHGSSEDGDFLALEEQLVGSYRLEKTHPDKLHPQWQHVQASIDPMGYTGILDGMIYATGAAVLEAKVVNRLAHRAPPVEVATALVELGDWHLAFSGNGAALQKYRDAYDLLGKEDASTEVVAGLFSPDVPAILPAFVAGAMAFDPARQYRGYIDVSIRIGRYGQSTGVALIGASSATSNAIETRLKKYIGESRFRPRFVDGRLAGSDRFSLRYYFDYEY